MGGQASKEGSDKLHSSPSKSDLPRTDSSRGMESSSSATSTPRAANQQYAAAPVHEMQRPSSASSASTVQTQSSESGHSSGQAPPGSARPAAARSSPRQQPGHRRTPSADTDVSDVSGRSPGSGIESGDEGSWLQEQQHYHPPVREVQPHELDSIPLDLAPEDINIGDFIGSGVYSEVFRGLCYGTPVAVKRFKNQGFDPDVLKEVRKEVRIMKSIRHPNLLLFLGACTIPGHLMIVTELLYSDFHDVKQFDLFAKISMAREAAKGVSWLHSLSPAIIHRDLKPENILKDRSGKVVKVADFGLSLVRDQTSSSLEEMKRIRGSPAFMSPEALLADELNTKTDVYSFGMILWELLSMRSPYESLHIESFEQLIEEICEKGTRESIADDAPLSLRQLIECCWHPNPEFRPDFMMIIVQLDECLLEVAIPDIEGRKFWKRYFFQNGYINMEVPWQTFIAALSQHIMRLAAEAGVQAPNVHHKVVQALKIMLVKHNSETVTVQEFGRFLQWFGPLNFQQHNFIDTMQRLFTKRWFHGDISLEQAQTRLGGTEPGTFLIRFSSSPGQYALSKVVKNARGEGVIVHIRIMYRIGGRYSFSLDGKTFEFDSLEDLVKSPVLHLTTPCPGSKYYSQFRVKQTQGGYVNTVLT